MTIKIYTEASSGPLKFINAQDIEETATQIRFKHIPEGESTLHTAAFILSSIFGVDICP